MISLLIYLVIILSIKWLIIRYLGGKKCPQAQSDVIKFLTLCVSNTVNLYDSQSSTTLWYDIAWLVLLSQHLSTYVVHMVRRTESIMISSDLIEADLKSLQSQQVKYSCLLEKDQRSC